MDDVRERFSDRRHAGRLLAARLAEATWSEPVVLALPRGGVPIGAQVAVALNAPLDVIVTRKIGAPRQPELAVGAVSANGDAFFDQRTLQALRLTPDDLAPQTQAARAEAHRRRDAYSQTESVALQGKNAIIVDDGLATGLTALAAVHAVRAHSPSSVTVAVPVGSKAAVRRLSEAADAVVCLAQPDDFRSVGQWYVDFSQVGDEEVTALLG